jgi:hypothetical protein
MKKTISAFLIITAMALMLGGCMFSDGRGSIVKTPLTLRNATDYEIESFGLIFMGSTQIKRVNPMEYPYNDDGTQANTSLEPGEEREFTFSIGTNELTEPWGVNMNIAGAEDLGYSNGTITFDDVKGYEITLDDTPDEEGNLRFLFTAFSD